MAKNIEWSKSVKSIKLESQMTINSVENNLYINKEKNENNDKLLQIPFKSFK